MSLRREKERGARGNTRVGDRVVRAECCLGCTLLRGTAKTTEHISRTVTWTRGVVNTNGGKALGALVADAGAKPTNEVVEHVATLRAGVPPSLIHPPTNTCPDTMPNP